MSPELEEEIVQALRKLRAPAKVSRHLGVDISAVLSVADRFEGTSRRTRETTYDGFGRPELQEYIVARKMAYHVWDNEDPAIAEARANYEAGTHDMCTGRDGDWLILYSIPQRRTTPRPDYFKPEV